MGVACFDEAVNRWFGDDDPAAPGLAGRIRQVFVDVAREFDEDALRPTDITAVVARWQTLP
jgi:hypothetical protein